jgi:hypothetical protein
MIMAQDDPIWQFCNDVMRLNNGAHAEIAASMATRSITERASFVERCASMASAVAQTIAEEGK